MRPEVVKTQPLSGFQGHSTASVVTLTFARALDTSVLTPNIVVWDVSAATLCTPYTLSYIAADYKVIVDYAWEPATDYQIQVHRDLRAAVMGTELGREYQLSFTTADVDVETAIPLSPSDRIRTEQFPTFMWLGPSGATLHEIEVSSSSHFEYVDFYTSVATQATLGAVTLEATPITLQSGFSYYWRVKGIGGPWSPIQTFFYGVPPVGILPLAPFEINRILPADMSIQSVLSAVTLQLSTAAATPTTAQCYWRTAPSMMDPDVAYNPWVGDWSVSGNNLVWTPAETTLTTHVRYELFIDELYDTTGRAIELPVVYGQPVYAVCGPYTPLLASPNELAWAPSPAVAGLYLQLASERTISVAASTAATDLKRNHALVGARLLYMENQVYGWMPEVGRSAKLGDYQKSTDPEAVDGWLKIIDQLKARYDDLENQISDTAGAYSGRRGVDWDPSTDALDWFYPERRQGDMLEVVRVGKTLRTEFGDLLQ